MRNATAIVVLVGTLGAFGAEARYYRPMTANFLSADRAGMIDGPNEYAYVRNRPTMLKDPTGMFSDVDIDPEAPFFEEAFLAVLWIDTQISLWNLQERPCWIDNWDTVKARLMSGLEKDITLKSAPSVWQQRGQGQKVLPGFNDPLGDNVIWLTPAAGHLSITSPGGPNVAPGGDSWEPTSVPTPSGFKHVTTWIGFLGHEYAHMAGYPGTSPFTETVTNQVGVFLESLAPNYLPLDPRPYNAGPPPP